MSSLRVDFYVLNATDIDQCLNFVCRLCAKAYQRKQRCYVHTDNADISQQLDKQLWQFKQNSFIPHHLAEQAHELDAVLIGHGAIVQSAQILINLAQQIPDQHTQFPRIIELAPEYAAWRQQARQHYQIYKQHGYDLTTHHI